MQLSLGYDEDSRAGADKRIHPLVSFAIERMIKPTFSIFHGIKTLHIVRETIEHFLYRRHYTGFLRFLEIETGEEIISSDMANKYFRGVVQPLYCVGE